MTQDDLIYTAGLFDGEGCITSQRGVSIVVAVSMTSRSSIQWLQDTFGGSMYPDSNRSGRSNRPSWRWQLTNQPAKDFLALVRPYLRVKQREAWLASAWPCGKRGHKPTQEQMDLRNEVYFLLREAKKEPI